MIWPLKYNFVPSIFYNAKIYIPVGTVSVVVITLGVVTTVVGNSGSVTTIVVAPVIILRD